MVEWARKKVNYCKIFKNIERKLLYLYFRYDPKGTYTKAYLEEKSKLGEADNEQSVEYEKKEKDE